VDNLICELNLFHLPLCYQIKTNMKINKYRIKMAWVCYTNGRKNGRNIYWSIRLALYWFSGGFNFEGDITNV
jgi:hypothetical protein